MLQRLQHAVHSSSRLLVANSSLQTAVSSTQTRNVSRAYPDEPRVGVGVVVFRHPSLTQQSGPEVIVGSRTWTEQGGAQAAAALPYTSTFQRVQVSGCRASLHPADLCGSC
jgi:hypothetical protein